MGGMVDLYISLSRTICFAYSCRNASGDIGSVIPSSNATEAAKREYMGGYGNQKEGWDGNDCSAGNDSSSATSNMQSGYRRTQRIPCKVRLSRSRYPVCLTSFISASGRWIRSTEAMEGYLVFGISGTGCACAGEERAREATLRYRIMSVREKHKRV